MTVVVMAARRRERAVPVALVYIGIPAYLIVVGFSVWDIVDTHSPAVSAVAVAAVAAFTAAFLWLALATPTGEHGRRVIVCLSVMAVLAVALAFLGATTALYMITVAAMAGDALAPRLSVPVIVAASGGVALYEFANESDAEQVLTAAVVPLVVGLFAYGVARLTLANEELVAAREELATLAVANERLRFARDMHDLLGHSLTVIRAKSELAARLAPADPARAGVEMDEVERLAREALAEVRQAVSGYRHSTLAAEVANSRVALGSAGIEAEVAVDGLSVAGDVDEALGWVLREAVTNVVRHSRASRCRVEAAADETEVRLEVADDGDGPSPEALEHGGSGTGLTGVRERLAAVGGTLELGTTPGGGFRIVARVPRPA